MNIKGVRHAQREDYQVAGKVLEIQEQQVQDSKETKSKLDTILDRVAPSPKGIKEKSKLELYVFTFNDLSGPIKPIVIKLEPESPVKEQQVPSKNNLNTLPNSQLIK